MWVLVRLGGAVMWDPPARPDARNKSAAACGSQSKKKTSSGLLWLVLEEAHGLDIVSLVEGEAVVDPGRQHEQISRTHLNANPLSVLGVLNKTKQ